MIRIAVCDDDIRMVTEIESLLSQSAKENFTDIEVSVFYDGDKLEKIIRQGGRYDIIYLDIEMKRVNGVEAARYIRKFDSSVLLIYISAHETYLKELFEVETFRFLSKPVDKNIFKRYFYEACHKLEALDCFFEYKFNKEMKKVLLKEVQYFESVGRTIRIHMGQNTEDFYGKLNNIENELKGNRRFLRIHQSYFVNYDYIRKIGLKQVELFDGTLLMVSRERRKNIRTQVNILTGEERLNGRA